MERTTMAITLSYDGAGFSGFARQPGIETVQGRIESALATVFRCDIQTVCAGRTDAGVHALGQVVSFEVPDAPALDRHALLRSLNGLAGPEIVVREVREAEPGFSARFDAVSREYRYRIVPGPVPPLFLRAFAWWPKYSLDLGAMRRAAEVLVGEHDFRSFCVADSVEGKKTLREMELIEILPDEEFGEHCVVVRVVGNAFLHSMVRTIVGSLVEVGAGRRQQGWIADVLAACDRASAGPTAPAHGLTLWHVTYPDEVWL